MADDAPPPTAPDHAEIDAVASVLRRMIADGHGDDAVALVVKLLVGMRAEIDALQHKLQVTLRMLYGRRSEKLTEAERAELTALLGDEAKPDGAARPAAGNGAKPAKKPLPEGAGHGRGGKPSGLPEERTKAPVPEAERLCPKCQGALHPLVPVETWRVEYEPGHFVVQVTEREQLSCRRCRDVVVTAPMPPTVDGGPRAREFDGRRLEARSRGGALPLRAAAFGATDRGHGAGPGARLLRELWRAAPSLFSLHFAAILLGRVRAGPTT
jgi:hypothetical protein